MDESLVAMALSMGLPVAIVSATASKLGEYAIILPGTPTQPLQSTDGPELLGTKTEIPDSDEWRIELRRLLLTKWPTSVSRPHY
jgi:hypothetical protein